MKLYKQSTIHLINICSDFAFLVSRIQITVVVFSILYFPSQCEKLLKVLLDP